MNGKRQCKCGCGAIINCFDNRNRERFFVCGHSNKGKSTYWSKKPNSNNHRTGRWRARLNIKTDKCIFAESGCSGRVEVHHIDKNPMNNDIENIIPVCKTHHAFLDSGVLTITNHKIPNFYVDKNGKRRYHKVAR